MDNLNCDLGTACVVMRITRASPWAGWKKRLLIMLVKAICTLVANQEYGHQSVAPPCRQV